MFPAPGPTISELLAYARIRDEAHATAPPQSGARGNSGASDAVWGGQSGRGASGQPSPGDRFGAYRYYEPRTMLPVTLDEAAWMGREAVRGLRRRGTGGDGTLVRVDLGGDVANRGDGKGEGEGPMLVLEYLYSSHHAYEAQAGSTAAAAAGRDGGVTSAGVWQSMPARAIARLSLASPAVLLLLASMCSKSKMHGTEEEQEEKEKSKGEGMDSKKVKGKGRKKDKTKGRPKKGATSEGKASAQSTGGSETDVGQDQASGSWCDDDDDDFDVTREQEVWGGLWEGPGARNRAVAAWRERLGAGPYSRGAAVRAWRELVTIPQQAVDVGMGGGAGAAARSLAHGSLRVTSGAGIMLSGNGRVPGLMPRPSIGSSSSLAVGWGQCMGRRVGRASVGRAMLLLAPADPASHSSHIEHSSHQGLPRPMRGAEPDWFSRAIARTGAGAGADGCDECSSTGGEVTKG